MLAHSNKQDRRKAYETNVPTAMMAEFGDHLAMAAATTTTTKKKNDDENDDKAKMKKKVIENNKDDNDDDDDDEYDDDGEDPDLDLDLDSDLAAEPSGHDEVPSLCWLALHHPDLCLSSLPLTAHGG